MKNGVVIPLMTELDEQFRGFDGAFKLSVDILIPIIKLLPWKKLNLGDIMLYGHMNN